MEGKWTLKMIFSGNNRENFKAQLEKKINKGMDKGVIPPKIGEKRHWYSSLYLWSHCKIICYIEIDRFKVMEPCFDII